MTDAPRPHPFLSWLFAPRGDGRAHALRKAVGGKWVLLTGASFGIGEALALRLGAAGAKLVIAARSADKLAHLQQQLASAGGTVHALPLDLASPEQIASAAAQLAALAPEGMDVVIHNAGKSIRRAIADSLDRAHDFQRTMAVNYLGPVQLQLALLKPMLANRRGHIVNVSTLGVRLPPGVKWSAYTASKAAFDLWLACAAPELRPQGIRCTSVYLGLVHTRMSAPTEMYRNMPGQTADEAAQVVCRALISRPRRIQPWWVTPARWFAPFLEAPTEWAMAQLAPRSRP